MYGCPNIIIGQPQIRGHSSAGRALRSQRRGRGFESRCLHWKTLRQLLQCLRVFSCFSLLCECRGSGRPDILNRPDRCIVKKQCAGRTTGSQREPAYDRRGGPIADKYRPSRSNVRQFVDNLSNYQNVFHKGIHIIHFLPSTVSVNRRNRYAGKNGPSCCRRDAACLRRTHHRALQK